MSEFPLGQQIADWLRKELPGAVTKAMQAVNGLKWTGVYEPGKSYSRGDMIRYADGLWVATGTTTAVPAPQSTEWDFML